jgi:hypothetical protein
MVKYKLAKGWTKSRYREWEALRRLLYDVASINSSTGHLENTARCIKAAKKLIDTRWIGRHRTDFVTWLQRLALIEVDDEK